MKHRFQAVLARAALAAACVGLVTVAIPGGSAVAGSGPKLTLSQSSGLTPNQTITISGKKLKGDNGDALAQCSLTATDTSECDLSTEVTISVDSKGDMTPVSFTAVGPGDGLCTAPALKKPAVACGIGLVDTSAAGPTYPVTPVATMTFPTYYLSLGDSYSVGYQPSPAPGGATYGYTGYVAKKEKLTLENFGCGGATTESMTTFTGVCGVDEYGPPAAFDPAPIPAGDSQETAADAFIAAHPGQIGLITMSIGGNDVTPCAAASPTNPVNGATDPITCVENGVSTIQTNLTALVDNLSTATNGTVPIVGLTYPDVLLGLYVCTPDAVTPNTCDAGDPTNSLIADSQLAFETLINPTLSTAYTSVPLGKFVNVTSSTGGYGSLTKMKNFPPYGKIPDPVAEVCKYTWYCSEGNIHANTLGYALIGKLVTEAL